MMIHVPRPACLRTHASGLVEEQSIAPWAPAIAAKDCADLVPSDLSVYATLSSVHSANMRNRDTQYLELLRDYYAANGVLPSFSIIARLVGLKSTSAVSVMVSRLKEQGFLSSAPDKRLQPGTLFFERQRIDFMLPAGSPQTAQDISSDPVLIDRYLVDEPSRTLLAQVTGESMIDAGLLPGDTIIIKRGAPAQLGDIVVAKVDGEYTIKYLARDKIGFYLKAGNPDHSDIRPEQELEIVGRITGSFRKYS